jgi:hypothetical protein
MRSTLRDARSSRAPSSIPALCVGLALALLASGCGGGGASTTTPASAGAQASSSSRPSAALQPATVPVPRLSILSPRTGAHTASTLTVGVALEGAARGGARRFRYVLDHRLTRLGSAHLTFHDLAPGRHRLEVFLATNGASRATTAFTVRAPAPIAIAAPVQTTPMTTSSQPAPTPSPPSPPTTGEASPPPTAASPSPPGGGIPQGGGGDGDGDNSGGPSDGDGNK